MHFITGFIAKHLFTIISIAAGAGVVATAVVASKEGVEYEEAVKEEERKVNRDLTLKEKIGLAIRHHLKTIIIVSITIGLIFAGGYHVNKKISVLSALASSATARYAEFRQATLDEVGEDGLNRIDGKISKIKENMSICSASVLDVDEYPFELPNMWFYENETGQFFRSTILNVRMAEYHLNRNFVLGDDVNLNTFLRFLGLNEDGGYGQSMGWPIDVMYDFYGVSWIDFSHAKRYLEEDIIDPVTGEVVPKGTLYYTIAAHVPPVYTDGSRHLRDIYYENA